MFEQIKVFFMNIWIELIITIIVGFVIWSLKKSKELVKPTINVLLNNIDYNSKNWKEEIDKVLEIKTTVERHFPEYKDYLLIQYGSSVIPDNKLPSDYDFIVLLLGYPIEGNRYMHNKGTISDESNETNKDQVDIVFRDYLSFLFAASAGMPYENSVIYNGKLVKGHQGYFQWLKNITKNILFDKDFLIRRFKEKIIAEKQEFHKCLKECEEFGHDKYYVIRAGYYYITSILQLRRIQNFEKVITQNQVIELSKVRSFYEDILDDNIRNKYEQLVENLKRNNTLDLISIDDIKEVLLYIGEEYDKNK